MKCSKFLKHCVPLKYSKLWMSSDKNTRNPSQTYCAAYKTFEKRMFQERVIPENNCFAARSMSLKKYLDYSKVPKLDEADIEIQYVRGSGPGGQATNRTNNAVQIKHKPTGIVVKSHQTRSMWENKKKATENLITKLDNLINGEESIEGQIRAIQAKKSAANDRKKRKLNELKAAFKEREGLDKDR